MDKPLIIAFYLPQYHPIPENDEWWGKGFTEWTNVGKAKPLFRGHYQPKVPADLGYYDLRIPEVREQQAELAREAGVNGFCYWHYWFGNGKELLERPFKEVVESGKPDFPFCLGWANENWQAKLWNANCSSSVKKDLIVQEYPGNEDIKKHFYSQLNAFKDSRYIRINNRPLFLIYSPLKHPQLQDFFHIWNALVKENNVAESFYFVGLAKDDQEMEDIKKLGFDAVTSGLLDRIPSVYMKRPLLYRMIKYILRTKFNRPIVIPYSKAAQLFTHPAFDRKEYIIPTLIPNWDHSPRSGGNAVILHNATPEAFQKHCETVLNVVKDKENKIIFLKSWNEWGEGNYMEPDLRYGKGYIQALAKALKKVFP